MFRLILPPLIAVCACFTPNALAQSDWDPLAGVSNLVSWFTRLNDQIDKVVVTEKRGQLLRSIDRLRKDLYALEADAKVLKDSVPDSVPSNEEREQLSLLSGELQSTVQRLAVAARAVGADLRLNESEEIEFKLTSGLRTRSITLTYFQRALQDSRSGKWDAKDLRSRFDTGIQAANSAQLAVTAFRQKLSGTK